MCKVIMCRIAVSKHFLLLCLVTGKQTVLHRRLSTSIEGF